MNGWRVRDRTNSSSGLKMICKARLSDKDKGDSGTDRKTYSQFTSQTELDSALPFLKRPRNPRNLRLSWGKSVLPKGLGVRQANSSDGERAGCGTKCWFCGNKSKVSLATTRQRVQKHSLKRRMSRWNFTKISKPSSLQRQLEKLGAIC